MFPHYTIVLEGFLWNHTECYTVTISCVPYIKTRKAMISSWKHIPKNGAHHFCFISVSFPSAQQIQHLAVLRSVLPVFYHNRMELEDSVCRCWAGLLLRTSGSFICQFAFCINSHSVQHYINCIYGKFSEACVHRICAHTVVHLELSARLPFVALDSVTKHIWFTLILRVIVFLRRSGRRGEDVTAVGRRCNS